MTGKDGKRIICKYFLKETSSKLPCLKEHLLHLLKEMSSKVTHLKEYLAGIKGDVDSCKSVPKEVKYMLMSYNKLEGKGGR